MEVFINQNYHDISPNSSVQELLIQLQLYQKSGIAVAVNQKVIPKINWADTLLSPQDQIDLITASQGG